MATASHTAEISGLNQSLERAKEELGQLRMQLRDKQGMHKSCSRLLRMNFQYEISFVICARDCHRSRGSQEGCGQGRGKGCRRAGPP